MDQVHETISNELFSPDYKLPICFKSSRQPWKRNNTFDNLVVSSLFTKQIEIQNENYDLPNPDTLFTENAWSIKTLQSLKQDLNAIKSQLDNYSLIEWRKHTGRRNKAGDVKWSLQRQVNPEFLTQAWSKFYEIVSAYPLVPEEAINTKKFKSIHLCEAPGAFVTSLNHWLQLNAAPIDWKWTATTLNPHYEGNSLSVMITDDRFILHTLNNWYFGADNTGNLMNLRNLDAFVEMEKADCDIPMCITADGSISCSDSPAEQEAIVSHLHYCETIAALHLLNENGSFLLKIFTVFEHQTVCLMYLLSCCFERVIMKKPATSKEGNSEVYVVCLRFKGPEYIRPYLNAFRRHYEDPTELSIFRRMDIPNSFINQIWNCAKFFKTHQCQVILDNIQTFNVDGDHKYHRKIKQAVADHFIKHHDLRSLSPDVRVIRIPILPPHPGTIYSKCDGDSYSDRLKKDEMSPQERFVLLAQKLETISVTIDDYTLQFPDLPELRICTGLPYERIQNSKFCHPKMLETYNAALEISESLGHKDSSGVSNDIIDNGAKHLVFRSTMAHDNYHILKNVWETIKSIENHQALIINGYSLLTQFNVGLFYLLGHTFESVVMKVCDGGSTMTFNNYFNKHTVMTYFEKILDSAERARINNEFVLSVVPITHLSEDNRHHQIMDVNHRVIKNFVNRIAKYSL